MPGVVADQLPGEDPPGQRPVQGHGRGELDLPARQLPAVVGVLVGAGERLRQPGQPLAGEPVDLLVGQPVADPLDRLGVADRAERVVQGRERDAFLPALLLGVLVPVEVDLAGVREITAELDMERAEIGVEAIEIPVAGHCLLLVKPRIGLPGRRVPAPRGPPHPGLLLGHPDEQDALPAVMPGQVLLGELVLALPLREPDQAPAGAYRCNGGCQAVNRSVIGSISAEETNRLPRCWQKKLWIPCPYCSRGCRSVSITRSMQRTSSVT